MAERRSLGQALDMTPDKMAFIQVSATVPTVVETTGQIGDRRRHSSQPQRRRASRPRNPIRQADERQITRAVKSVDSETPFIDQILVPLTTRISQTANALKRVCLEQKLQRRKPDSTQEIVELAVSQWLAQQGFLD